MLNSLKYLLNQDKGGVLMKFMKEAILKKLEEIDIIDKDVSKIGFDQLN